VFVAAGAGAETTAGPANVTPAYPGSLAAGDFFVCVANGYLDDVTAATGWTEIYRGAGGNQNFMVFARDTRASGSESGTVNFPIASSDRTAARIYAFRNCAGTTATAPFEAAATAGVASGAVTNPTITPTGAGRLGVLTWGGYTTATVAPGGTPTGGTWVEPVAEYISSGPLYLELQTADLSAGGAISGGTTTAGGSNQSFCHGFALIGV